MSVDDVADFIGLWFHVAPKDLVWFKLWLGEMPLQLDHTKDSDRGLVIARMVIDRYMGEGAYEQAKTNGIGYELMRTLKQVMIDSNNWRSLTPTV